MAEEKKSSSMGGMLWFFLILLISIYIASKWNSQLSIFGSDKTVKEFVGSFMDPVFGRLIEINVYLGFIVIVGLITFLLTLAQKYLSDQAQLKEIRKEQKYLQEEMKKYKDHPEKLLEFQKKQLEFFPRTFELTMKPMIFTSIPIILLFRWFSEIFQPKLGGWWILYYLIGAMIFSSIFRKWLDVA